VGLSLQLRPFRPEFGEAFAGWRAEEATVRHNPLDSCSVDELIKRLSAEGFDLQDPKATAFRWLVCDGETPIGSVSLKNISKMMRYGEIGYMIGEKFQGRGVGTAAVKLALEKIFNETDLRRIFAYVHDENAPSRRLLEKLGFKNEGLLREHYLILGKPADEVVYGLLRTEWENS
jgi:ribosomal-protein-alanine N-acetyltransferase